MIHLLQFIHPIRDAMSIYIAEYDYEILYNKYMQCQIINIFENSKYRQYKKRQST